MQKTGRPRLKATFFLPLLVMLFIFGCSDTIKDREITLKGGERLIYEAFDCKELTDLEKSELKLGINKLTMQAVTVVNGNLVIDRGLQMKLLAGRTIGDVIAVGRR